MSKYDFKSITEIEQELIKSKKYDFKPCEECIKEKDYKINKDKIVILEKDKK